MIQFTGMLFGAHRKLAFITALYHTAQYLNQREMSCKHLRIHLITVTGNKTLKKKVRNNKVALLNFTMGKFDYKDEASNCLEGAAGRNWLSKPKHWKANAVV